MTTDLAVKKLTILEAEIMSLIVNKINSSQYELNEALSFMQIEYSKETDGVRIETKADADVSSNHITLLQATLVAWFMPQLNSIQNNFQVAISLLKTKFDRVGNIAEIELVCEPLNN